MARVAQLEGCVIATGGGVVLDADNMANLRRKGVIILLEARPEVIARRVSGIDDRPLLSGSQKQPGRLVERIEALMRQRAPLLCRPRLQGRHVGNQPETGGGRDPGLFERCEMQLL